MIKTNNMEIKFQRNYKEVKKKEMFLGHTVETVVEINLNDEEKLIGNSVCSYRDRFVKEEGRKLALKRALETCFNRSVRTAIWQAYWASKSINKPKEIVQHY